MPNRNDLVVGAKVTRVTGEAEMNMISEAKVGPSTR